LIGRIPPDPPNLALGWFLLATRPTLDAPGLRVDAGAFGIYEPTAA
jgi:hypothetical protein